MNYFTLILSNFDHCNLTYKDQEYICQELAFQHQRALMMNQPQIAAMILNRDYSYDVKNYTKY